MIGEIALLIKGLDTACSLVRAGLDRKKAIEDMGGEISSFFASKEAVEAKIVEVKKHNKDAYLGSALEEAIQIEQQSQKIENMMKTISQEYSRQGKSHKWQEVKKNAANIQKARDSNYIEAIRRKVNQDRKDEDFYLWVKIISGLVLLMAGIAGLVFALAVN